MNYYLIKIFRHKECLKNPFDFFIALVIKFGCFFWNSLCILAIVILGTPKSVKLLIKNLEYQ